MFSLSVPHNSKLPSMSKELTDSDLPQISDVISSFGIEPSPSHGLWSACWLFGVSASENDERKIKYKKCRLRRKFQQFMKIYWYHPRLHTTSSRTCGVA